MLILTDARIIRRCHGDAICPSAWVLAWVLRKYLEAFSGLLFASPEPLYGSDALLPNLPSRRWPERGLQGYRPDSTCRMLDWMETIWTERILMAPFSMTSRP